MLNFLCLHWKIWKGLHKYEIAKKIVLSAAEGLIHRDSHGRSLILIVAGFVVIQIIKPALTKLR